MRLLRDRLHILDVRAAKDNMRDGNQQRFFVDGFDQTLGGHVNAVIGADHVDARATAALRLPEIHHRREIHVAIDDFVAPAAEIEAAGHHVLAAGNVQMHAHRAGLGVHQHADGVAHVARHHPPVFFPCAHAARGPDVAVGLDRVIHTAGHGAQRVADHISGALQNGELRAKAEQVVSHGWSPGVADSSLPDSVLAFEQRARRQPAHKFFPCRGKSSLACSAAGAILHFTEMKKNGSGPRRKLTLLSLAAATYFMVSGGPYGMEELVQDAGYKLAVVILFVTPLIWSLPTGLMVGELAAALPAEGGFYVWVRRAMGPFWGFQEAWLSLRSEERRVG